MICLTKINVHALRDTDRETGFFPQGTAEQGIDWSNDGVIETRKAYSHQEVERNSSARFMVFISHAALFINRGKEGLILYR
ncbi:hypothetical protein AU495_09325 [Lonsdalea populi]|nr:hypothetical protein AU494_11965 [Lonsdalea populi]RAT43734.1 hypothetical protein AU495_09325 [Lonsdalea populi]